MSCTVVGSFELEHAEELVRKFESNGSIASAEQPPRDSQGTALADELIRLSKLRDSGVYRPKSSV